VRKAVDSLLNVEYLNRTTRKDEPKATSPISSDSDEENSIWSQKRPGGVPRPKVPGSQREPAFPALGSSMTVLSQPVGSRSQSPVRSRWEALDIQINFLSQSLSLPPAKVRSSFHSNGSSLSRTLRDLLKDIPPGRADEDVVANLKASFKNVDIESLQKIIIGIRHNLDHAPELARILEHDKIYNLDILGLSKSAPPIKPPTLKFSNSTVPKVIDDGEGTLDDMTALRTYYLEKRNEAFAAASHSYRQSKSDSKFSGVAAYYAEIGREYDAKFRNYSNLAANRLVASQSSGNSLDLHGVSTKDAVRLVEEGVTAWWARVQVIRERGLVKAVESYVIIVGKGDRQKGGSKLGPPVGGWLRRNGWGFQEAQGEFVVWGLRKNAKEG
jgi:hypothetical protein